MKKIIIAINKEFTRKTYVEVFRGKDFEVFETGNGKEVLSLLKKEDIDVIFADVELSEINGFDLLKKIKEGEKDFGRILPVIIFAQYEKKKDREKAMELEAKDFITAATTVPLEVVRRVKIALGEQKSYLICPDKKKCDAKNLITDLGYDYDFKCSECGSDLAFDLIRDLSKGEKHYILSVVCPNCGKLQ